MTALVFCVFNACIEKQILKEMKTLGQSAPLLERIIKWFENAEEPAHHTSTCLSNSRLLGKISFYMIGKYLVETYMCQVFVDSIWSFKL